MQHLLKREVDMRMPVVSDGCKEAKTFLAIRLFEPFSDALVVANCLGLIVDLNPAAEKFFGYVLDEIEGKPITLLIVAAGLNLLQHEVQPAVERTGKWQGRISVQTKRGGQRVVDSLFIRLSFNQMTQELPLTLMISREIAEQMRVEHYKAKQIREPRFFRRTADAAPVMIWKAGADALSNYFNRPWLGNASTQEFDDHWADDVHPDDVERCTDIYRRAFAAREPFQMDYRVKSSEGHYRWLVDNGAPRYGADGRFEGYVGSCIDITDRKALEDALQVRTEQLVRADRRKDEFLAMLSHELRNPLAPITNSLAIMRSCDLRDPILVHSRRIIERQVEHLRHLVNDLLDVSRISSGKVTLNLRPVLLNDIVHQALEISAPQISAAAHRLTVSCPDEPVYVEADQLRLAQALSNILNNAAQFTPEGGEISVEAAKSEGGADISVRDSGIGISKAFQPRLFEMFTQADESLARTGSGLGIGLAVARQILDLHHGTVEARSEGLGYGSEFTLHVPLASVVPEEKNLKDMPTVSAKENFRILLIDDNEDANGSMAALLELFNYEVRTALDAPSALKLNLEFEPHLILSDIGLPGMDGYELAPKLRTAAGDRKLVIAAATGYGYASDFARSQSAGFDHHLVKPIDADTLLAFVAKQAEQF